jgi:hypothetical protein
MSGLRAYGISAAIPQGWEARVFRHEGGEPTLHVATFPLPPSDGDFGSHAISRMPPDALFLALTEYRVGRGVEAGRGLFAAAPPDALHGHDLSSRALQQAQPGRRGLQRFFSVSGRAFCLYVVASGASKRTEEHLATAARIVRSLRVEPR